MTTPIFAEIKTSFERWQSAEYLEKARSTEPFDPDIYEADDDVELGRHLELRRSVTDLLLVEQGEGVVAGRVIGSVF